MELLIAWLCLAQDAVAPGATGPAGNDRNGAAEAPASPMKKKAGRQEGPQEERPERPLGTPRGRDAVELDVRAGLDLTYNDNVLRLDDRDVDRLEEGTKPEKFRIDRPDDFIWTPWAEAALRFTAWDEPTTAGLRLRAHLYQTNSILNYEEVTLFLRRKPLDFEYTLRPEVYRQEYRELDTGQYASAFYTEHVLELGARFRPEETLLLRPKVGLELRDYDSPFNHRDAIFYVLGVRGVLDATDWLEASLAYEFVLSDAFAGSGQPDTSYVEHGFEPGVAVKAWPDWTFELRWRFAARDYTTDNDASVDPGHRGRSDDRRRLNFRVRYRVSKDLVLEADYRRTDVDSDLPSDPGATDEETSWSRNEVLLGITYQF